MNGRIMMSTENGITSFHTKEKIFNNWTRGEGLLPAYFNASAGTVRQNKGFVFGSTDGVIELPENVTFPKYEFTRLIFSDFYLSYQPIYPGDKGAPLQKNIDETDVLELGYDENTFRSRFLQSIMILPRMHYILGSWKDFMRNGHYRELII